ncbi:MAG: hypothetical protein WBW84_07695 [Acidobacteriaceae bacterium]
MKTTAEIGMKITATQREFRRYTGVSAEVERRGFGASRLDLCWGRRFPLAPDSPPSGSEAVDRHTPER